MNIIQSEEINKNLAIEADQIITFLKKVKNSEETEYEKNKKFLDQIGINVENFDELVTEELHKLSNLQYELGCKESSYNNLILHAVDHKTDYLKQQQNVNKLKREIKKISKLTEESVKQTKTLQRDGRTLQNDQELLKVDQTEQKELEEKLKRYKAVLKKLENDLHKYNLPEHNIIKYEQDIENFKKLQRRKIELSEKLAKYMGASPDIDVLCKQVEEIELQYREIKQKFTDLF